MFYRCTTIIYIIKDRLSRASLPKLNLLLMFQAKVLLLLI